MKVKQTLSVNIVVENAQTADAHKDSMSRKHVGVLWLLGYPLQIEKADWPSCQSAFFLPDARMIAHWVNLRKLMINLLIWPSYE